MKIVWQKLGVAAFWFSWPALWVYLHNTKRTRLLIICGGEFLALRGWLGAGEWNLPGGGLHKNEEPLSGLMREVREETGLTPTTEQIRFLYQGSYHQHGFRFAYDCYVLELYQKPIVRMQKWEIVDHAWLPIKSSDAHLAQDAHEALAHWLSQG